MSAREYNSTSPSADAVRIEFVPVDDLVAWPANPKAHDLETIRASLRRFGFVAPAAVDEATGRLVAGHGRAAALRAMREAGEPAPARVRVLPDGRWALPVVRGVGFADEGEAEAYVVADNQLTIAGGWHDAELAAILDRLSSRNALDGVGFDRTEIDAVLARVTTVHEHERKIPEDGSEDLVPDEPKRAVTKPGDVWILGRHRLACGDCRESSVRSSALEGVEGLPALGLHDPPYGMGAVEMGFGDGQRHGNAAAPRGVFRPIVGDDGPYDPMPILGSARVVVAWGANHYADRLPTSPAWIVWDKRGDLPSNAFSDAELAWVSTGGRLSIIRHRWNGMIRDSERGEARVHPTQKPVAVHREIVRRYTSTTDVVVDYYAGSGTTLIAAEAEDRDCRAIEIDPLYCDVVVERWQNLTGGKATRAKRRRA